jgi:5'-nucleotidase
VSGFDVILGDHTNFRVNQVVNDQLVVENLSAGATYALVQLTYDFASRSTAASAELLFPRVTPEPADPTFAPDPAVEAVLAPFRAELATRFDPPIGVASDVLPRSGNNERLGQAAIGNLVADAIVEATGADLALVNGGGCRSAIPSSYLPSDNTLRRPAAGYAEGPPYDLVVGDAYALLPFGNSVAIVETTEQELFEAFENGFGALPAANGKFPQVSGVRVVYAPSAPPNQRVCSITLADGTPLHRQGQTVYRVATSDFVSDGGDGYSVFVGNPREFGDLMAAIAVDYVRGLAADSLQVTDQLDDRLSTVPSCP